MISTISGSLNQLAHATKPDLSNDVSLLAQHQSNPSLGHLEAAYCNATKYLASTKHLVIYFTICKCSQLASFFYIFQLLNKYYLWRMLIGDLRMCPSPKSLSAYHFLLLSLCRHFILINFLFIGYQSAQQLQPVVPLRLKYMLQMNALSSY